MREGESRADRRTSACVAIVAILALLVAPFCAPLCAAKVCAWSGAGGGSQSSDCHHEALADDAAAANSLDAQQTGIAAATGTACNPPELQATALGPSSTWRAFSQVSQAASHFLSSTPTQSPAFASRSNRAGWIESCTAIGTSGTPSATTVLRI